MVLIHTVGDTGDFISVTLIGGNHVQFEYESGKGPQGVTVETAYRYALSIRRMHEYLFSYWLFD